MQHPADSSSPGSTNESVAPAGDENASTPVNPNGVSLGEGNTAAEAATQPNTQSPSESSSDAMQREPQSDSPTEPPLVSAREKNQAEPVEPSPLVDLIRESSEGRRILVRLFQLEDGSIDSTGVECGGQGIALHALPPALRKSLLLPTELRAYESVRQLFDSVRALFQQHVMLSEKQYMLLSY